MQSKHLIIRHINKEPYSIIGNISASPAQLCPLQLLADMLSTLQETFGPVPRLLKLKIPKHIIEANNNSGFKILQEDPLRWQGLFYDKQFSIVIDADLDLGLSLGC